MIGSLGGPNIPGIGWAAGVERISMLMEEINVDEPRIHIAISDEKFKNHLIKIINYFRKNEIIFWNYKYNLKNHIKS